MAYSAKRQLPQRYDGLGDYARQAEANGTTLQAAFASYAALEGLCRRDPCAGIDSLAGQLGWNHKALAFAYAQRHGIIAAPPPAPEPDPVEAARTAVTEQQSPISPATLEMNFFISCGLQWRLSSPLTA